MKSLPGLDVSGRIILQKNDGGQRSTWLSGWACLGKYCSAHSPHLNMGRRPQSCTGAFANQHSFTPWQGTSTPPATGSGLWSCWGKQQHKPPPCCPSITPGKEEEEVSYSSLSTLLYGATLVQTSSFGVQPFTCGLHWFRALRQRANELCNLWVGAALQVLWRHLLPPDRVQSPGSQPGGSGQPCLRLHLPRHPAPHHPLHSPPCPPAFRLPSCPQPPSCCLATPPAIPAPLSAYLSSWPVSLPPQHLRDHAFLQTDRGSHRGSCSSPWGAGPQQQQGPFPSCCIWGGL